MPASPKAIRARRAWALLLGVALAAAVTRAAFRAGRERADFVFTGGGEVRTLDPHAATGVPEGRVIRALFEGLLVRDPLTLAPAPGCAESWDVSADGSTWTFRLRSDARWSNGDALTAHDFVWTWTRLLEPSTGADYAAQLWCVEGAREYSTGVDAEGREAPRDPQRLGFRAVDERTLEVRLREPNPRFADVLCFYAFAPLHRASIEALRARHPSDWETRWTRPEALVSNGPYRLLERRINERIRLGKSESYWNADTIAMRTVDLLAVESWTSALNLYLTGEIDWVDGAIPANLVHKLVGREDFRATPYLGVYFYRINTTRPPLNDARVRRALSSAVQRAELTKKILKAGQSPSTSFVPWGAIGAYKSPAMPPASAGAARAEFAKAGFAVGRSPGKPFPALEIHFNTSETHRALAEVVAHQWKTTLGIPAKLRNQEWKSFLAAQSSLDYDVSRSSWIADYPDPLNFLEIWTSDNPNNRTGWSNAQYDEWIAKARRESDEVRRNQFCALAERILLVEAPCIPIYSYVSQNLVDPALGGFDDNALNEPSLAKLYWRDAAELASERERAKSKKRRVESHGPAGGLRSPAAERERAQAGAELDPTAPAEQER